MKNKSVSQIISLIFAIAIFGAFVGCAPVTLHSIPEGAAVYEPGGEEPIGVTPYKTKVFTADKTFEVRSDQFKHEPVTIGFESSKHVYVDLKPRPVTVSSIPAADVFAENIQASLGTTPVQVEISKKGTFYNLKAEGYYDKEIRLGLDTPKTIEYTLDRRPIITVSTTPENVEIYENGERFTTSPMTEEILTDRTFELRKEGYYAKSLNLTSSSEPEMNVELIALPVINIKATPSGAMVYLVGKSAPLGKAPVTLTIEEKTSFEVRANRYYPETFTLEAKSQTADIQLKAMPYVMISSRPSGATITVNGSVIGKTPVEKLIEENTVAELSLDGYISQKVTLTSSKLKPMITLEKVPVVVPVVEEPVVVAPVVEKPVAAPIEKPAKKKKWFWQR